MSVKTFSVALLAAASVTASIVPALSIEKDAEFFNGVEGSWRGPGEIVAGKYKGTKFVCDFTGLSTAGKADMTLDGSCRVGVFTQKMSASIKHDGKGYTGKFLDGAAGKGLDVTSGNVDRGRVVFGLHRKQLRGAFLANLSDPNSMKVTISVRVNKTLVPVIGMNLKRLDGYQTGMVKTGK